MGRYGWVADPPDPRDISYTAAPAVTRALPWHVDLRTTGFLPPVYDQGQLSSCSANAIAGAYEYDQRKQHEPDFAPSRLFIYWNERYIEGTVAVDAGAQIRDGMRVLAKVGVCPEAAWPYVPDQFAVKPSAPCFAAAKRHEALTYQRVTQTLGQIQSCLASGIPVVFGFAVFESFESTHVAETGIVDLPRAGEALVGHHATLAVGYNNSTHRFIGRNSYGSPWGEGGYFEIPYAYLTSAQLASDFWALYTVE